jgi:hypothetical protein
LPAAAVAVRSHCVVVITADGDTIAVATTTWADSVTIDTTVAVAARRIVIKIKHQL